MYTVCVHNCTTVHINTLKHKMENSLVSTIPNPKSTLYTVRLFYIYPDRCFVNYGFKCVIAECFAYNDFHVAAMHFEVRERERESGIERTRALWPLGLHMHTAHSCLFLIILNVGLCFIKLTTVFFYLVYRNSEPCIRPFT